MRASLTAWLLVAALITVAGTAAGCGGDDDSADKPDKSDTSTQAAETSPERGEKRQKEQGSDRNAKSGEDEKDAKDKAAARSAKEDEREAKQEAARERREDREFDKALKATPFESLVDKLPIGKPPLNVVQYVSGPGDHTVYTRVDEKRFLCELTPAKRRRAVATFYRAADKVFRAGGVKDFEQVVTPVSETTEKLPALAIGRRGSVTLTRLGRGRGSCK